MPTLSPRSRDSRVRQSTLPAGVSDDRACGADRLASRCARTSGAPGHRVAVPVHRRPPRTGDLAEFADAALVGGVDLIQLRDKGSAGEQRYGPLEARQELEALEVLADAARRHHALLAVNDRADIAVAAGADVLHLGQDDLPLAVARDIVGDRPVIGRSTHDVGQVGAAIAEAVDYFCVGPCCRPRPNRAGPPRASTWSATRPGAVRPSRGSRSAASTQRGCPKCWRPARGASSWCGRSRPPKILERPPDS